MYGPTGRELQMEREALRNYINRVNGVEQDSQITQSDLELGGLDISALPRLFFHDGDGKFWKPQDDSGNFPYLPGYDGPL